GSKRFCEVASMRTDSGSVSDAWGLYDLRSLSLAFAVAVAPATLMLVNSGRGVVADAFGTAIAIGADDGSGTVASGSTGILTRRRVSCVHCDWSEQLVQLLRP